jgi:hypothetical protein
MQIDNVLETVLVAAILGDDRLTEAHSQVHVETHENVGRIVMREALASRAHRKKSARFELAAFLEEAAALHARGVRLIFVTGYPKTIEDARDLKAACPNLITFSLEDGRSKVQEANDPRNALRSKNYFSVDSSRGHGKRHRYMENCINNLLVGLQVSFAAANLDRSPRQLQEAFA